MCINNDNNNYPAKGSSLLALEQWPQSSSQLSCSLLHLREELNSCSQLRNAPNSASRALRLLAQAEHDSTTQVFNSKPIVKPRRESVICRTLWRAPRAKLNSIDGCPSSALHSTLDIEKKYYRNYVMYSWTITWKQNRFSSVIEAIIVTRNIFCLAQFLKTLTQCGHCAVLFYLTQKLIEMLNTFAPFNGHYKRANKSVFSNLK